MSGWVIVVSRQFSNFSAILWWEQVNFQWDDDEVCFVLDQHAELDFYSASSLKRQIIQFYCRTFYPYNVFHLVLKPTFINFITIIHIYPKIEYHKHLIMEVVVIYLSIYNIISGLLSCQKWKMTTLILFCVSL
jgi:hypothetical protein